MSLVGVGAEDGEDGALLARLRQQLVDVHLPVGEAEVRPRLALVGAEPAGKTDGSSFLSASHVRFPSRLDLLEARGGVSLCDGHQDAAVVAPRVEVGARQRLGSRTKSAFSEPSEVNLRTGAEPVMLLPVQTASWTRRGGGGGLLSTAETSKRVLE